MTSITDRLTDAMTAAASTVRDEELRPLAAPPRRRRPRAPRRWRYSAWAAPVAAAAAVTLVVGASMWVSDGFGTQHAAGPANLPPAPREFSTLIPNASFGWLPAGTSVSQGGVRLTDVFMDAGRPSADLLGWEVHGYARGRCHLTGTELKCTAQGIRGVATAWRISGHAPAVAGHRAFWAGRALVWQYARNGWAALMTPAAKPRELRNHPARQHTALKVARHIQFGAATPPLVFPAMFTGLPGQWQVSDVHYWGGSGVLPADEYVLTNGASQLHPRVGDVGIWTDAAYVDIEPTPKGATCTPHDPTSRNTSEVINGHRVVVKRMTIGGYPRQEVCATSVNGLYVDIQEFGSHPAIGVTSLFKHLQLLGPNPADWARNPVG
jgi:hypothetical protein